MLLSTLLPLPFLALAFAQECAISSHNGPFQLNPVNVSSTATTRRSLQNRQSTCNAPNALTITLTNGVLTDSLGRIGSIVANQQFQFDGPPPQAGALVVDGYSICANGSLATRGNAVWYQCSDLTRTSIYGPDLSPVGDACYQVYYEVVECGDALQQLADGQVGVAPPCVPITTMSDGQPVVSACPSTTSSVCVPITTLSDGQPVVQPCPTTSVCVPITTLSDGQPVVQACPTPEPAPASSSPSAILSQISDGQVQVVVPTAGVTPTANPSNFLSVNAAEALYTGASMVTVLMGMCVVLIL